MDSNLEDIMAKQLEQLLKAYAEETVVLVPAEEEVQAAEEVQAEEEVQAAEEVQAEEKRRLSQLLENKRILQEKISRKLDEISILGEEMKKRKMMDLFLKSEEERQTRMREEEEEMERRKNEGKELLGASTSTSTADMEEKCQICEANLNSLDAVGRAAHINKCLKIDKISTLILGKKNRKIIDLFLKSEEERQIRMREEEEEMERRKNEGKELLGASTSSSTADIEKCQICEANLNSLDAVGRAAHINKCLNIDKISRVILGNKNRKITDLFLKSEEERQTRMREEEEEMERRKNNEAGKKLLGASSTSKTADMERRKNNEGKKLHGASTSTTADIEKCQICGANLKSLAAVLRAAHIDKCLNKLFN